MFKTASGNCETWSSLMFSLLCTSFGSGKFSNAGNIPPAMSVGIEPKKLEIAVGKSLRSGDSIVGVGERTAAQDARDTQSKSRRLAIERALSMMMLQGRPITALYTVHVAPDVGFPHTHIAATRDVMTLEQGWTPEGPTHF
jgi:hypothetical protein